RVGRARGRRAGAALGQVAFTRRPATHDEARLEHVGGTGGAGPGAVLVHVTGTGRRAADGARIARRMLAGVARSVALIGAARVPVVGTRRARRCLGIRRAVRAVPRAALRRVALAARRPTHGGRRLEGVVGTRAARPGAQLVEVAVARRGATDRAGVPRCVLAEVARAVAGVAGTRVAVVGAERAARFLGIRPACLTRQATAALGDVALAGRRPADDPDRQEHIGRTRGAHAGAHLVGIARVAGACPADGTGIARRVLAGAVRAVAKVGRADVAVVAARRPRRALGVGRAARP